jgi:hypothetical protein
VTDASEYSYPFQHPAAETVHRLIDELPYEYKDFAKWPRRDRYLWAVAWFEIEVMNGGFDQYFYNAAGDHWRTCLEALETIGASTSYLLLKERCDLFPDSTPSLDQKTRRIQLEELTPIETLDDLCPTRGRNLEPHLYQLLLDFYNRSSK